MQVYTGLMVGADDRGQVLTGHGRGIHLRIPQEMNQPSGRLREFSHRMKILGQMDKDGQPPQGLIPGRIGPPLTHRPRKSLEG